MELWHEDKEAVLSGLIVIGGNSLASAMFSRTNTVDAIPVVAALAAISAVFPMFRTVRHAVAVAPGLRY